MEWWKAVVCLGVCARSIAGLLLMRLHFLLPPVVVLWWFGCALLAHTGRTSYTPIAGLRIFLGCRVDWLRFPRMTTFLLASCMFGLATWTPMGTLLGWTLTAHTFLWHCLGKRGQPRALIKVPLHLLTWHGYGTEAGPTRETRVVMHADNVVEVCRIIPDCIHAEWATWHTWPVPILGFVRPEDWNMSKCVPHMQLLQ